MLANKQKKVSPIDYIIYVAKNLVQELYYKGLE